MASPHCPACGEELSPNAKACPQCGADRRSGWSETQDGLDLPSDDDDDTFDYDEFIEREFGGSRGLKSWIPQHIHPVWWITAIVLLLAFLFWMF